MTNIAEHKEIHTMAKDKKKNIVQSVRDAALARAHGPVRRLAANETVTVRFLFEMSDPEGWAYLQRVHDGAQQRSIYHRADVDVPGARQSFFATALDVESGKVEVWELRKTLVAGLIEYDDEYGSVVDRNYRLKRRGERLDTVHTVTPVDGDRPGPKAVAKAGAKARGKLAAALDELLGYVE